MSPFGDLAALLIVAVFAACPLVLFWLWLTTAAAMRDAWKDRA